MTLAEDYTLARDTGYCTKVAGAMSKKATEVIMALPDPIPDPTAHDYKCIISMANAVLRSNASDVYHIAAALASQGVADEDGAVQAAVNTYFTSLSRLADPDVGA